MIPLENQDISPFDKSGDLSLPSVYPGILRFKKRKEKIMIILDQIKTEIPSLKPILKEVGDSL